MSEHLAVCPEELVPCKYASIGCQEVIKRKQLEAHLVNGKDDHLQMSMDMVMQLAMAVTDLSIFCRVQSMAAGNNKSAISHLPFPLRPWLQNTPTCYSLPPWVIRMEGFQQKRRANEEWFSDPVYSHFGGYKMCIKVIAGGRFSGKGTHVSVYIHLMRGDNDDNIKWPFKGTIKVSLLNQLEDGLHYTTDTCSPTEIFERVTEGVRAPTGKGLQEFISHQELCQPGNRFCINGSLFFRVDSIELKL